MSREEQEVLATRLLTTWSRLANEDTKSSSYPVDDALTNLAWLPYFNIKTLATIENLAVQPTSTICNATVNLEEQNSVNVKSSSGSSVVTLGRSQDISMKKVYQWLDYNVNTDCIRRAMSNSSTTELRKLSLEEQIKLEHNYSPAEQPRQPSVKNLHILAPSYYQLGNNYYSSCKTRDFKCTRIPNLIRTSYTKSNNSARTPYISVVKTISRPGSHSHMEYLRKGSSKKSHCIAISNDCCRPERLHSAESIREDSASDVEFQSVTDGDESYATDTSNDMTVLPFGVPHNEWWSDSLTESSCFDAIEPFELSNSFHIGCNRSHPWAEDQVSLEKALAMYNILDGIDS